MSTRRTAVVCDDHGSRVEQWSQIVKGHLGEPWEVASVSGDRLAEMVAALSDIEANSRDGHGTLQEPLSDQQQSQIDLLNRADLVLFDSDLTPNVEDSRKIEETSKRTLRNQMGDTVARQIRSFTSAGFIAVVNMFWGNHPGDRVFDLTMMQSWRSHADLHVSDAEIEDEALWTGRPTANSYHPWHWPALATAHELVRKSETAIPDLDAPALPTLGLDPSEFSPRQLDLFKSSVDTTFRQLTEGDLGFRYPTANHSEDAVQRMAASVVRRWASRTLLAGQNVVSDAPHLLTRFSPLMGEAETDESAWRSVTDRTDMAPSVLIDAEEARLLSLEPFVDRPVYSIAKARELIGRGERLWRDPPDLAFAEDVSAFVDSSRASGFQSDLPGPYLRRFVLQLEDVDYEPSPRLLK